MPTTASRTYSEDRLVPALAPHLAVADAVPMTEGTYAKGTVLGMVTATERYAAYANANSNGTEVARCVLAVECVVDADGNVTFGDATAGDEHGAEHATAPVFIGGYFRTTDLTGLDAAGVTDLGRIVKGVLADGILRIN